MPPTPAIRLTGIVGRPPRVKLLMNGTTRWPKVRRVARSGEDLRRVPGRGMQVEVLAEAVDEATADTMPATASACIEDPGERLPRFNRASSVARTSVLPASRPPQKTADRSQNAASTRRNAASPWRAGSSASARARAPRR